MILVKIRGGLSNQLFQYACARALAHRQNTHVVIDRTWFDKLPDDVTPRLFDLAQFNIDATYASTWELIGTNGVRNTSLLQLPVALWRKINPRWHYFEEKEFAFDPRVLQLPDQTCLYGYWCSEKYFDDCAEMIRDEFQVRKAPDHINQQWITQMQDCTSVAVHIRRGDYASNPLYTKIHGLCSPAYYAAAVKSIASKYPDAHLFIFSDDPAWVAANMTFELPHVLITHNRDENNFEDLRLMMHCKHHIIANSGFSWWGAWLAKQHDKTVIAPKKWFNEAKNDTRDLYPTTWITL